MEKALAAIHQANHLRQAMSLEFGTQEGRVALFLRSLHTMEEFIVGPITANYPNCSITAVEPNDPCPSGWETWTADLELAPELFPILRHAQFEDMLNRNFADPINGILRCDQTGRANAVSHRDRCLTREGTTLLPSCACCAAARPRILPPPPPTRSLLRSAHHAIARLVAGVDFGRHCLGVWGTDTNDPRNLDQPSA